MTGTIKSTTVDGKKYNYWADFNKKCTYAEDETGNVKAISSSGYITKDLTVRKAIAISFRVSTFRK